MVLSNSDFYDADGAFLPDKAKQAYLEMMERLGYPVVDRLRTDEMWGSDFGLGDFVHVGMGGIFWWNSKEHGYFAHEIYLLPGQMIVEHSHVETPDTSPKMEAWHVRHGSVDFFGEHKGAGDEKPIAEMPEDAQPWGFGESWFKSRFVASRTAGQTYRLEDPESWHFQRAGPNGAVVSEYATYHNQVEFSKPGMEFASSGPAAASE